MKNNLRDSIIVSLRKIADLQEKAAGIQGKLEKLQLELQKIDYSINQQEKYIAESGYRTPSREAGRPDSPEELESKLQQNLKIAEEKNTLVKAAFEKRDLAAPENLMSAILAAAKSAAGK